VTTIILVTSKEKIYKDDRCVCELCGLVVWGDGICGYVDVCDIILCEQPMKRKEVKAKATKKVVGTSRGQCYVLPRLIGFGSDIL